MLDGIFSTMLQLKKITYVVHFRRFVFSKLIFVIRLQITRWLQFSSLLQIIPTFDTLNKKCGPVFFLFQAKLSSIELHNWQATSVIEAVRTVCNTPTHTIGKICIKIQNSKGNKSF